MQFRIPGRATPERVSLRDVAIKGRLGGTPLPRIVDVAFEAPRLDYEAQDLRIRLPAWKAAFAGAALEGGLDLQLGGEDRRVDGRIAARVESLREVLRAVGVELPATRDPRSVRHLRAQQRVLAATRGASSPTRCRFASTRRGSGVAPNVSPSPTASCASPSSATRSTSIDISNRSMRRADPLVLQLGWLKSLKAEGELALTEARVAGAVIKGMRINVQ